MRRYLIIGLLSIIILTACQPTPESGAVLFSDGFASTDSGWNQQVDAEAITDYTAGEFQIAVLTTRLAVWSYTEREFDDVIIEVDARTADGPLDNLLGIICRRQDDTNFYYLVISGDGYYGIGRVIDSEDTLIHRENADWDSSDLITTGLLTHHLTATCIGNRLALAINGELLAETIDDTFSDGTIGLYAKSLASQWLTFALTIWLLPNLERAAWIQND